MNLTRTMRPSRDETLDCPESRRGRHRIAIDERGRPVFADATRRRGLCRGCGRKIERAHTASGSWYAKTPKGTP